MFTNGSARSPGIDQDAENLRAESSTRCHPIAVSQGVHRMKIPSTPMISSSSKANPGRDGIGAAAGQNRQDVGGMPAIVQGSILLGIWA